MQDSIIIWRYLESEYPNDSQTIYIYCTKKTTNNGNIAINFILNDVKKIFYPPMSLHILEVVVKAFLELKYKLYMKGEIKINSIY